MEGGKSSKSFWQRALRINPYYFAVLLLGMFVINIYHVISLGKAWSVSPIYFLSYALIQSLLEVLILVFIGSLIKTYLKKPFYYGFVSLCFLFFILHYIDFLLIRFMDMSVYYGLQWVFAESLENFIELLHITGISITTWMLTLGATLVLIPLFALLLYGITEKLTLKKSVQLTHKGLVKTLCCLPIGLIALDMTITPHLNHQEYRFYQKVLPWKSTLLAQKHHLINMQGPLKKLPPEKEVLKRVHLNRVSVEKKPNIYLFVVESLRQDFLTEETAQNITSFRKDNIQFKKTFSSGNATQISWYSIFHSKFPLYWAEAKKKWTSGSIPLQILKKLGYNIHVYSAAQLNYYGLSKVMFGKRNYLADSYNVFPHYFPTKTWESDTKAIDTFMGDLNQKDLKEGNVFVFFLDSTHFNYSWPENYPTHFQPISEEKTHLRVSNSLKNIELIKNRYRNSIHFMDSLFGEVVSALKDKGLYDESVIIFTGDHGEEFFEEGQLFHASHLSSMQTEPPIYMKLGDNQRAYSSHVDQLITSHIDIFPTILDYIIGYQPFTVFDGESVFSQERSPFVMTGRFHGPRMPEEFFIHNGEEKCTFRFFGKSALEIQRSQSIQGEDLNIDSSRVEADFRSVINKLFH